MASTPKDPKAPGAPSKGKGRLSGLGAKMKERFGQFKQIISLARAADPRMPLWIVLILGGGIGIGLFLGLRYDYPIYFTILGFMIATMPLMLLLAKKAQAGAYRQISGMPGQVGAVLSSIRKGWSYQQEPVAADTGGSRDPRQAALVYRAVGRAGVVLIAEGPVGRASKLLSAERKRTSRLLPNVPVHTLRVGTDDAPDVVDTGDLLKKMNSFEKKLTKHEVPVVDKRLRSISVLKPPVPQGIDPNRMRGKNVPR